MSINHEQLERLVAEMEQGVAATTQYSWLDLAKEILRMRENVEGLIIAMEKRSVTAEPQNPDTIAGYLREIVLGENNG